MSSWEKHFGGTVTSHTSLRASSYLCVVNPLHGLIQLRAVAGDGCGVLLKHSQQRTGLVATHLTAKWTICLIEKTLATGFKLTLKHSVFFGL